MEETQKTTRADIGDIIRAEEFAFGYHDGLDSRIIDVDGETKSHLVQYRKSGTPWDEPAEYETVDHGAHDHSRGEALFVVEKAQMQGGGTGHGPHDVFPDGWYVEARRLHDDCSYNSQGEVIRFYQSGCFTCFIPEVEIVGKMRMLFVRG